MKRKIVLLTAFLMMLFLFAGIKADIAASAEEEETEKPVEIGSTDYENLVIKLYPNDNSIIYMSVDNRKTWIEVIGASGTEDGNGRPYIEMDISWASTTSNVKIYFKGNNVKTETSCTLPKQNSFKVKFDKVSGDFTMTADADIKNFYWRKASDSTWNLVPMDKSSGEYKAFLKLVESLRFKGAKLVFRTGQIAGTDAENMGSRPSKEVNVSISKFSSAPSIKLNYTKLTLNTKATMEYTTDINSGVWIPCEKGMGLDVIAPQVFVGGAEAAKPATIYFRTAQTEKRAASLIKSITIPAQKGSPTIGEKGKDVTIAENETTGKFELTFNTASAENAFEYCVITPSKTFELTKAKWKTIKKEKTVNLTQKNAPDGTVIYVRLKGTAANEKKNIEERLPSAYATFTIKWKEKTETNEGKADKSGKN